METKFDYDKLFEEQLELGQEFQDHCMEIIWERLNILLGNYSSKKYQYKHGENMQGFELKYDRSFEETGNLWIEVSKRKSPYEPYYTAGIYHQDNAWLYCIGNYKILFIFSKKLLRQLHKTGKYLVRPNKLDTSKCFLLSTEEADKYCAHKIGTLEGFVSHIGGNA